MEEEEESCHKCKCIFIDETGSQSSCSVTDDYIAREIQKMELVFKSEEAGQESELLKGVSCDVYSLDSNISSGEDQIRNCSETDSSDNDDDLSVINLDTILKKDTSAFLFRNENLEPLTFVLLLNDSSAELKLKKIIEKSGGLVYPKVKDMDDYSIVLVKDSKLLTAHVGPVFKLDYLLKCVSKNKIVSINSYQRTFNNAPPLHNFDFMNVVYFKQLGWSEVPYHVLLNKLVKDVGKVKKECEITPPRAVQCTVRDSDEEVGKMNKTQQRSTVQENSDDEFRITNKAQKQSTVAARKNNKSQEQSTAEAQKTNKMQQRSTVQDSSDDEFRITYKIQKRSPQKQFKHMQPTFFNSSSDDIDDDKDRKTKPPKLSPIKSEKLKRKNINRHTRMLYSDEEDSSIVRYIADNDGYNSVKGTLLWRNMERVNICPKRTWQSMKEHFLKKIMYNTNSFAFLTDSQKRKFQKLLLK